MHVTRQTTNTTKYQLEKSTGSIKYSSPVFGFHHLGAAIPNRMDWDDDAPPDLVGTETGLEPEEKPVKVPITIVTGAPVPKAHVSLSVLNSHGCGL